MFTVLADFNFRWGGGRRGGYSCVHVRGGVIFGGAAAGGGWWVGGGIFFGRMHV